MCRGPGHGHRLHAVLGALDAWHPRMEPRLVLTGVEVTPAPLDVVVRGRHGAALRTRETRIGPLLEPHVHCLRGIIQLDSAHLPWRRDSQDGRVQRPVVHCGPLMRKSVLSWTTHSNPGRPKRSNLSLFLNCRTRRFSLFHVPPTCGPPHTRLGTGPIW